MVVHRANDEKRARLITSGILGAMTLAMATPFVFQVAGHRVSLVENLGFEAGNLAPPTAWILAIFLAAAYVAWSFWAVPFIRTCWREISLLKALGIAAALTSGVMEEVIFRRFIMDLMSDNGFNDLLQVVASAILFGLAHLVWRGFGGDWLSAIYTVLSTTVAGLALGALYLISGRSLGPCILAHVLINLIIEPWLLLSVVREGAISADSQRPNR